MVARRTGREAVGAADEFFIEHGDHAQDPPLAKALAEPSAQASLFQVLGSYPRGVVNDDYHSPWKHLLKRYFPAFLAWFFPAAHADIHGLA